jgi:hypothetical protein
VGRNNPYTAKQMSKLSPVKRKLSESTNIQANPEKIMSPIKRAKAKVFDSK